MPNLPERVDKLRDPYLKLVTGLADCIYFRKWKSLRLINDDDDVLIAIGSEPSGGMVRGFSSAR